MDVDKERNKNQRDAYDRKKEIMKEKGVHE